MIYIALVPICMMFISMFIAGISHLKFMDSMDSFIETIDEFNKTLDRFSKKD
ncbi:hypothetical protein [Bacillus pseudomycoides]|uniref:hypothetical protein n=1 Tax=Bacillus pseudomycoides TaxID=64104 RepID=UPI0012B69555|nr:hypothetical protein [Bacillus pseudomycoides]